MLRSFAVRNFRCLEDFEVHNLARVNLLVGDNDAGKTALLEALFAHLLQTNLLGFLSLKAFRRTLAVPDETFWKEFFTRFDDSREIHLSSVDDKAKERKSVISVGRVSLGVPQSSGESSLSAMKGDTIPLASFKPLHVEFKDGDMKEPLINDVTLASDRNAFLQRNQYPGDLTGYLVSTAGPPESESIAKHLSELVVQKRESNLLAIAKLLDEQIRNISVVSPQGRSEVFVDLGEPPLIPLTLMGTGVLRAIGIASAIPAYVRGVVLIDEIDDGIYYKRLGNFWHALLNMAKTYDAQIVASTHSAECIAAAINAVTPDLTDSDPLHVYRMIRGKSAPIPYEGKTLQNALELAAEVR
jgi:hypothetical protein